MAAILSPYRPALVHIVGTNWKVLRESHFKFRIFFQIALQMGSLGAVKLLRDKRPAEVTKNLVKDISNISNISNKSIKMGNLCSAGPSAAAKKVLTS